jgi:alkanesulfonate monooxygenase SsuD/methylene tetrahydromethanopterin reductase-like flavin-dependent oxidoreductase (luciferase family)
MSGAAGSGQATPFARGSIAVGLHPIVGLDGRAQAAAIVEQAQEAERAGFSGVTLSEHHGGFPGYMGLPALACNWILGATERIWSGPAPYLVNLRNPVLAAEELAWSAARWPGRFGAALAPGYARSDFELLGVPWEDKAARFEELLADLLATLRGEGKGAEDPAFRSWAAAPAPLMRAANTRKGVERAAALGMGVYFPSGSDRERMRGMIDRYRELGGPGPVNKVRMLWMGELPPGALEKREQTYRGAAAKGSRQAQGFTEPFLHGDPDHIAQELVTDIEVLGLEGVNIRFHLEGGDREWVREQIGRFGAEVIPRLVEPLEMNSVQLN